MFYYINKFGLIGKIVKILLNILFISLTVYFACRSNVFASSGLIFIMIVLNNSNNFYKNNNVEIDHISEVNQIIRLIRNARNNIIVFCGSINPEIYCDPRVIAALKDAIERPVHITFFTNYKMALNRAKESKKFDIFIFGKEGVIKIFDIKDCAQKSRHFIIVDNTHLRYEEVHDINSNKHEVTMLHNLFISSETKELYTEMEKKSVLLDKKKIIDDIKIGIKELVYA
jgi:hypothetical protein